VLDSFRVWCSNGDVKLCGTPEAGDGILDQNKKLSYFDGLTSEQRALRVVKILKKP